MHISAKHAAGTAAVTQSAAATARHHRGALRSEPRAAQDWKQRALEAYRQVAERRRATLQLELADRVALLTEQAVAPSEVYVNDVERFAVVTVAGIVFRLQHHQLAILRPCGACDSGLYQSPPIDSMADLGFALAVWEPRCHQCDSEDGINWYDEAAFN